MNSTLLHPEIAEAFRIINTRERKPARVILPIADLYADLIAAVNRGDLPGAQQLAAQIAA